MFLAVLANTKTLAPKNYLIFLIHARNVLTDSAKHPPTINFWTTQEIFLIKVVKVNIEFGDNGLCCFSLLFFFGGGKYSLFLTVKRISRKFQVIRGRSKVVSVDVVHLHFIYTVIFWSKYWGDSWSVLDLLSLVIVSKTFSKFLEAFNLWRKTGT